MAAVVVLVVVGVAAVTQLKPRMVMTPLAISPPSSTPEPDMSSIPQDAATVPHSATPQVLTGKPRPLSASQVDNYTLEGLQCGHAPR